MGEAMACWMYQTQLDGVLGYCEIALNATKDKDVINIINESKRLGLIHKKKLDEFMKAESISPSDGYVQKPAINVDDVPNGVKQTEKDIVNTIQINLVTAFGLNASALSQCLRTDLQIIFFKIMTDVMIFGQSINILSEKRGWLRFPPTYHPN
ncbi:DUF3231 family protein [Sporolactobacillus pectinivorans]|uniref:DUF3231 family protein n=1 Tax=Sporolactobacillus pectinivorans TaxID=1591408 RepID=UPI000C25D7DE|nr:DUF3231 family protein [Sporolactobacillus pectinivorans]